MTSEKEGKKMRNDSRNSGSEGSAGPLYFKGFLGEIRGMNTDVRDSFWGLIGIQQAETQYVASENIVAITKNEPLAIEPTTVTSAPVSAE